MIKKLSRRTLIVVNILTFLSAVGCSTSYTAYSKKGWVDGSAASGDITREDATTLVGKRAKFYTDEGEKYMSVERVEYPYIYGKGRRENFRKGAEFRVDLRDVTRIDLSALDNTKTGILLGALAGLVLAIWAGFSTDDNWWY